LVRNPHAKMNRADFCGRTGEYRLTAEIFARQPLTGA